MKSETDSRIPMTHLRGVLERRGVTTRCPCGSDEVRSVIDERDGLFELQDGKSGFLEGVPVIGLWCVRCGLWRSYMLTENFDRFYEMATSSEE